MTSSYSFWIVKRRCYEENIEENNNNSEENDENDENEDQGKPEEHISLLCVVYFYVLSPISFIYCIPTSIISLSLLLSCTGNPPRLHHTLAF